MVIPLRGYPLFHDRNETLKCRMPTRPGKFRFESSGFPDAGIPECAAHGQTR